MREKLSSLLVCSAALLLPLAESASLPNDPMEPIADARGAVTGPLSGAVLITRDLELTRRAYAEGVGMTLRGPLALATADRAALLKLWQWPQDLGFDVYLLSRPEVADSIQVLIVVPQRDTPVIRRSFEREETGPYALGFPMRDVPALDRRLTSLGLVRTLPQVNRYSLQLRMARRIRSPRRATKSPISIAWCCYPGAVACRRTAASIPPLALAVRLTQA